MRIICSIYSSIRLNLHAPLPAIDKSPSDQRNKLGQVKGRDRGRRLKAVGRNRFTSCRQEGRRTNTSCD
ncbi:hypothetical protein C0Q70_15504 [Pomacea canaliculata]|uniref:Uncharacterized protein n=1 Tax=Pomacea canaliculata TaxID=400727 RepID=A0A2T7NV01_POMCA|nr:hypothetical protein C0Q70_15504 [Pomacea canaliculata]